MHSAYRYFLVFKQTSNNFLRHPVVKPFLKNKGGLSGNDILLVKDDKMITEDNELAETFNDREPSGFSHRIVLIFESS